MKRLTLQMSCFVVVGLLGLYAQASAQGLSPDQPPPPQGVSRGENFSAKPPAQLFASDCTGAGCHKGPQGLNKGQGFGGLAGFLREHYTNSRESAAALAAYLSKIPAGPEPKETRASARAGKPAEVAPTSSSPGWAEGFGFPPSREKEKEKASAKPNEPRGTRESQKPGKPTRAASRPDSAVKPEPATHHPEPAKPEEEPAAASPAPAAPQTPTASAHETPEAEPESSAKPAARTTRRSQPTATAAAPPAPPPAAEIAPAPAPAAPKQYDIFD